MTDTSPDRMDLILNLLNERPSDDWEWRFEPDVGEWSAVNALALGNVSLLAYSDWADIQRFLGKWHFSDPRLLSKGQTQGFVARRDNAVFVSFRGTEPLRLAQWVEDISYAPRSLLSNLPGSVHGGFASLFDDVKDSMWNAVDALSGDQATRLFVTGHSLGGALAVLAAAELEFDLKRKKSDVTAVYTYGQPRVGNPEFCAAYDAALKGVTFRYVNDLDIVPHVPSARLPEAPTLRLPTSAIGFLQEIANAPEAVQSSVEKFIEGDRFAHVGQLLLFVPNGSITNDETAWQEREVIYSGSLADLLRNAPSLFEAELGEALRPQDRLLDHDPLRGYLPRLIANWGENTKSRSRLAT
jgi:triacylglycerol lipase